MRENRAVGRNSRDRDEDIKGVMMEYRGRNEESDQVNRGRGQAPEGTWLGK